MQKLDFSKTKLLKTKNEKILSYLQADMFEEYKNDDPQYNITNEKNFNEVRAGELNIYALTLENEVLGCFMAHDCLEADSNNYIVNSLFVCRKFQGLKIGKYLLSCAEKKAKKLKAKNVALGARFGKEGFYIKCGYKGEAMIQCDAKNISKEALLQVLKKRKIKPYSYSLWNNCVHQFYFDASYLIGKPKFLKTIKSYPENIGCMAVFTKPLNN